MLFGSLCAFVTLASWAYAHPTVTVVNGTYVGVHLPSLQQDIFLGIPFAQPPIGDLRLAPPASLNSSWSDTRSATTYGPGCVGSTPSSTTSEDCLHINVVRPANVSGQDKLPVLFWIFGGGFVGGAASSPAFNGSFIVEQSVKMGKPIIFASIDSYGYLASDELKKAGLLNVGIKDQRMALHWVSDNIGAFGGDADKVTIWGHSSGGYSIHAQLLAYGGRNDGLFRAAIADSSLMAFQNWSIASQTAQWDHMIIASNCTSSTDKIRCLRALSTADFSASINAALVSYPVPDDDLLPKKTLFQYRDGNFLSVPTIIGATKDDGTSGFLAPTGINNNTYMVTALNASFTTFALDNNLTTINNYLKIYPNDPAQGAPYDTGDGVLPSGSQDKRSFAIFNDMVHGATRYAAQQLATKGKVYSYRFNQIPQNGTMTSGVTHGSELGYIFANPDPSVTPHLGTRSEDIALALEMQSRWINFVHDLDPLGTNNSCEDFSKESRLKLTGTRWEPYGRKKQNLVFTNSDVSMQPDTYRAAGINYAIAVGLELV
ncbi:Alpha/Beta hydrolase protein [Naematelia encephala]|uniref:Carboxylic ester hydrolase n=1 Tax=Naematelia encephala TaxID=71784 RepID=A0A1Y2AR64_9TREE|nr:Alpha/Beta hydrolase protein [Naematelia encephala]